MFLPSADIMWRSFHYNQRLLFYALDNTSAHDPYASSVDLLKSGLADALVDFFPWAARAFEQEDGRLALDCNDAGVEFIEASIDVPFSSLEQDGFQYRPFFKQLAPMGELGKGNCLDQPLLSVQVTRFPEDEGVALGVAQSHVIADGHSLWHFMNSWAECSRGLPISMRPLHMRTELGPEKLILPERKMGDRSITRGLVMPGFPPTEGLVQRDFHFTGDMVQRLKQITAEDGKVPLTSYEALCAHLWKHSTAARKVSDATKSGIFVHANCRNRLVPPLPAAYFGNVIIREAVATTAEELHRESLRATGERVHGLIVSLDNKMFKTEMGMLEVRNPMPPMPPMPLFMPNIEGRMVELNMTSSPRFPVYEVDFGWGRPLCVRPAWIRGDGEVAMFPGREGGGSVDVCLALPEPIMQRLQHDHSFLSF